MPDNFTSELVDSAGEIFATDAIGGSSVHYPIGKLAWGPLNTATLTDTASPLPVSVFGSDSAHPVFTTTDSGAPPIVRVTSDSATELNVGNDSNQPLFVRGLGDSTVPVSGTVSVSGYVAPSTTVTVTNMSDSTVTVANSSSSPFFVRGIGDSTVPVSGTVTVQGNASVAIVAGSSISISNDSTGKVGVGLNAIGGNSAGALETFTTVLSSAIETVTSSAGRLYGYMLTNPDTASIVYAKLFSDDSTGVTKGTTSPALNLGIPPEGGANVTFAHGLLMSSGISLLAAGGSGLTDTSAPASNLVVNLFYKD